MEYKPQITYKVLQSNLVSRIIGEAFVLLLMSVNLPHSNYTNTPI